MKKCEWRNTEPWISIEGVLRDVKAAQTGIDEGMTYIRDYMLGRFISLTEHKRILNSGRLMFEEGKKEGKKEFQAK